MRKVFLRLCEHWTLPPLDRQRSRCPTATAFFALTLDSNESLPLNLDSTITRRKGYCVPLSCFEAELH
jgi:hypothetical protein